MTKIVLLGFVSFCAWAQSTTEPPTLLRVVRNTSRLAGDANAIRPYIDAKAAIPVFGMTSLSGASETWLVEAHDSFASIENLDRTLTTVAPAGAAVVMAPGPDELLTPSRSLIALYRPEWSYRPEEAMKNLATARYLMISIYRAASDADFGEMVRSRRAGLDRVNLNRPDLVYDVVSGAASETYLLLAPLVSLRTLDDGLATRTVHPQHGAENSPGGKKAVESGIGRENLLFRVEPRMSYVSEEFASADPEFWGVKKGARR